VANPYPDPLDNQSWFENHFYPIFSAVFFDNRRDWVTDQIRAAIFRAISAPDAVTAADIILEVLPDLDRIALIESIQLTGRFGDPVEVDIIPVDDTTDDIREYIDDGIDIVGEIVDAATNTIVQTVLDVITQTDATTRSVGQTIVNDILEGQASVSDVIDGTLNTIIADIDKSQGVLGDILDILRGGIDIEITNEIIIPDDVFRVIVEGIDDILDGQRDFLGGIIDVVLDTVKTLFTDIIEKEEPELIDIAVAIREQTASEESADDEMLAEVRQINDDSIEGSGASLLESVVAASRVIARDGDVPSWGDLYKGFDDQVFDECGVKPNDTDQAKEFYSVGVLPRGLIEKIFNYVAAVEETGNITGVTLEKLWYSLGKAQGGLAITGAMAQRELYEFARCVSYEIFEPGDAIVAYQRNLISRDQLQTDLKMRGYNDTRADILTEAGYQIPDAASLYAMNLRGLAAGENLTDRFQDLGYNPKDAEALADLKFYIPPPQDLITMAVRDVFNPEVVAAFDQDQGFPEEFEFWAAQQGISSDWAHKYWQAHWVLPSIQMAFEMLHRRIIDEPKLRQLMAAQDIIPGWRDELIAISYRPYTRVDIRRMHDVGVLNEDEVYEAYQDIGYNDEKARTLTDFTIALNSDDPDDIEPLDGLTRSSIIAAYKDGIIDRPTADSLLVDEGVGEDARLIFLTNAELDIDRENRKDLIETVLLEFENGATNFVEATTELNGLALTPIERDKAEIKLRRLSAKKTKLPSKADLMKMYKNSIIGKGTFRDQMERLGYPNKWVADYVKLVKLGITSDDEPTV
jgi:hypothetical protein